MYFKISKAEETKKTEENFSFFAMKSYFYTMKSYTTLLFLLFTLTVFGQEYRFDYMQNFEIKGVNSTTFNIKETLFVNSQDDSYILKIHSGNRAFIYDYKKERLHHLTLLKTGHEEYEFKYVKSENFLPWDKIKNVYANITSNRENVYLIQDYKSKKRQKSNDYTVVLEEAPFTSLYISGEIPARKILFFRNLLKDNSPKEKNFVIKEYTRNDPYGTFISRLTDYEKTELVIKIPK